MLHQKYLSHGYAAALLPLFSLISLVATCVLVSLVSDGLGDLRPASFEPGQNMIKQHSYQGDDNPISLPLDKLPLIQMTVEESAHYSLQHSDEYEWLYNSPYGTGAVRVGETRRGFFVSMFHQLHCLRYFQSESHTPNPPAWPHVAHCFNYLRQMILCAGDLTLEPGDFTKRNFTEDRVGETHVCKDWGVVYDALTQNWVDWLRYQQQHGLKELPSGSHEE